MANQNKSILPADAAKILDTYLKELDKFEFLSDYFAEESILFSEKINAFDQISLDTLLNALVNGYEVEKSLEENNYAINNKEELTHD